MHVDIPRVLVWPNQDIFKHGILAGFPASFGTAENLSKFLMYCRSKGKNGWPNVWYDFTNFELYFAQISVIESMEFFICKCIYSLFYCIGVHNRVWYDQQVVDLYLC